MSDYYQELILDHYKNPRNQGLLTDPNIDISKTNASCGDQLHLTLKLKKQNEKILIEAVGFSSHGCAISISATSLLFEKIKTKSWTYEEIQNLKLQDMEEIIGSTINPGRIKCLTLPLRAFQQAVKDWYTKSS